MEEKTKMGRPTDSPKPYSFKIRLDEETNEILNEHSKRKNISRAESAREGIRKLKAELK